MSYISLGFVSIFILGYIGLLLHGVYVVFNELTGRKRWWRHGHATASSLTAVTLTVAALILVPVAWVLGYLISMVL